MEIIGIVALTLWLTLLVYPIFAILFYQRRDFYPISGRLPRMSLLESFAIFLFGTNECFYALNLASCNVYSTLIALCSIFFWTGFNYRLLVLLFNYEITKNIAELQDHRKFQDWTPSWYYRHRYLIKNRFWLIITVAWIILFCIIFIYLRVSLCGSLVFNSVFGMQGTLGFLTSVFLCYKLWSFPHDSFGLKNEFKGRVIPPLCILVISIILLEASPNIGHQIQIVGFLLCCHPLLYFSLIPPYFQSLNKHTQHHHLRAKKRMNRSPSEMHSVASTTIELISLENWLSRQEGITLFLDYLKTEFSTENLYFWLEVLDYKTNSSGGSGAATPPTHHDLLERSLQIYNKYVNTHTATSPINLSFEVSELTRGGITRMENLSGGELEKIPMKDLLGIFDAAQQEIYQLMNADSFYRFQKSESFIEAKDRVLASPVILRAVSPVELESNPTGSRGELMVGADVGSINSSPIGRSRDFSEVDDRSPPREESTMDMSLSGVL